MNGGKRTRTCVPVVFHVAMRTNYASAVVVQLSRSSSNVTADMGAVAAMLQLSRSSSSNVTAVTEQ